MTTDGLRVRSAWRMLVPVCIVLAAGCSAGKILFRDTLRDGSQVSISVVERDTYFLALRIEAQTKAKGGRGISFAPTALTGLKRDFEPHFSMSEVRPNLFLLSEGSRPEVVLAAFDLNSGRYWVPGGRSLSNDDLMAQLVSSTPGGTRYQLADFTHVVGRGAK